MSEFENDPDSETPPTWAAAFVSRERYERFESMVRHWFKDHTMSVVISDGVVRARASDHRVIEAGLVQIGEACASAPERDWPKLIDDHFENVRRVQLLERDLKPELSGWNDIRKLLVPRLWEPGALGDSADSMIKREDIPGLITTLALNMGDHIRSVRPDEAAKWDRSEDTLFETAVDNAEAGTQVNIESVDDENPDGVRVISAESVLVCARALRFDRFTDLIGEFGSIISIPVRHVILAAPLRDPAALSDILGILVPVTLQTEAAGPGSVSKRVYWRHEGVWREIGYELKGNRLEVVPPKELSDLL
ncbi:MAG: hypothetical protein ACK54H_11280 [Phycisphaerales bacterium]